MNFFIFFFCDAISKPQNFQILKFLNSNFKPWLLNPEIFKPKFLKILIFLTRILQRSDEQTLKFLNSNF